MRLPRFRFTVRRMMIAIAIVGVMFGGIILLSRRATYLRIAKEHQEHLDLNRRLIRNGTMPQWMVEHEAARIKYERAARYPWLSVEPDPPPSY